MTRYRATIEYDGTGYAGFQRLSRRGGQPSERRTVQQTLEEVLGRLTRSPIQVTGAGRTDTGVHARGQVIAWDCTWTHGLAALHRGLNALLPPDIAVSEVAEAEPGFHPRFDARSRVYEYRLYMAPVRPALGRQYVWHCRQPVDLAAVRAATRLVVGEHDFAAFGRPPKGENSVRRILRAEWRARPPEVIFEIEANAFLYRMVRTLVGTLYAVGTGAMSVQRFGAVLASAERGQACRAAPARGLCLMQVNY